MNYEVKSIESFECKEWFLKKHYARRLVRVEYSFGLFEDGIMVGVCTFGTPVSPDLRKCMNHKYKVYELNRLVTNEGLNKNAASFFVSKCLKSIPQSCCIVSYADSSKGHHGYIYQATNFIYTGLSAQVKDYYIEGMEHLHSATIFDISKGKENRAEYLRSIYGERLKMRDRDRKHRYFFFVGNKREKKEMLKMLPWSIEPYPKGDNSRYDASFEPIIQTKLF